MQSDSRGRVLCAAISSHIRAFHLTPSRFLLLIVPLLIVISSLALAGSSQQPAAPSHRSLTLVRPHSGTGTTYYVSSSTGNDVAAGTDPSTPWQTLAKVSSVTLQPGDTIALLAGDSWNEPLTPHGSGVPGQPITLTSYGNGARPQISAASGAAITLENQSDWVIQGIEAVASSTTPLDPKNTNDSDAALLVIFNGPATYGDITINNNDLHGLSSNDQTYGLHVLAYYYGQPRTALVAQNVVITNNTMHDVGWAGGLIGGGVGGGPGGGNMTTANGGYAQVQVTGNTIYNTGVQGFLLQAANNGSMTNNVVHDTGLYNAAPVSWSPSALWTLGSANVTIANNNVSRAFDARTGLDACGIDVDWDSINVTVANNQIHDNLGGGIEVLSSTGTVIRGNTIWNNLGSTNIHGQVELFDFGAGNIRGITNTTISGNSISANEPGTWALVTHATANYTWSGNSFSNNQVALTQGVSAGAESIGPKTQMSIAGNSARK